VSLLKVLKRTDVAVNTRRARKRGHGQVRLPRMCTWLLRHRIGNGCVKGFAVEHRPSNDLAWS
jgi:hypothetical protein